MFCSWFITLWKSSFPWTPPYPSEITAFEPPSPSEFTMIFRGVGGGVWIFSGTTQLHIKVECQVISKMKRSTTLNLSTKVPHEKSLEWVTIELLQTREFVLFFTIMHHKAKWLQRITKIKSFPSWHVWILTESMTIFCLSKSLSNKSRNWKQVRHNYYVMS